MLRRKHVTSKKYAANKENRGIDLGSVLGSCSTSLGGRLLAGAAGWLWLFGPRSRTRGGLQHIAACSLVWCRLPGRGWPNKSPVRFHHRQYYLGTPASFSHGPSLPDLPYGKSSLTLWCFASPICGSRSYLDCPLVNPCLPLQLLP